VCAVGQIVQLVKGTYHVSSVTCSAVVGYINPDDYFWYEGQTDKIAVVGTGIGGNVITCPSPGPCAYAEIGVEPSNGQVGIGTSGTVHTMRLTNVTVVDTTGTSGSCVDFSAANNQTLIVQGGTFQHCGGYCINMSEASDSSISGAIISNCQKGGIHVDYGVGNRITDNYIEDMYAANGIEYWGGGKFARTGMPITLCREHGQPERSTIRFRPT
jgi:parallel beta-helix repeat protein